MSPNQIIINADVIANGTVYANGPVIVQGVDIKAELENLQGELASLDQKYEKRVDDVFYFVLRNYEMKEDDRTKIQNALKTLVSITDWAGRVQVIQSLVKVISPALSIWITYLIKYGDAIQLVLEK